MAAVGRLCRCVCDSPAEDGEDGDGCEKSDDWQAVAGHVDVDKTGVLLHTHTHTLADHRRKCDVIFSLKWSFKLKFLTKA